MQYSDTTNKNGLLQMCEFFTGLGDGAISGNSTLKAQFTGLLNNRYHQVVTMILRSQDEWDFDDSNHTDYPILTTNLVANQQDYSIPVSEKVLKLKRVEVTYDGSNWYKAEPLDINQRGKATDTTSIANDFVASKPFYDMQYGAIFLYPIPTSDVTKGLKVWWTREIDEFTTSDTTQEPGFDEPFHIMLPIGASLDWAVAKGKQNASQLAQLFQDYEQRLISYYGSKQADRNYTLQAAYQDYH